MDSVEFVKKYITHICGDDELEYFKCSNEIKNLIQIKVLDFIIKNKLKLKNTNLNELKNLISKIKDNAIEKMQFHVADLLNKLLNNDYLLKLSLNKIPQIKNHLKKPTKRNA